MNWLLALPVVFLLWRTLARRRIIYGHREAFTFGYLFYVGLPLLLANTTENWEQKALPSWRLVARIPGPEGVERLIWWSILVWFAFLLGHALASRRVPGGVDFAAPLASAQRDRAAWTIVLGGASFALALFAVAWAIQNRALLFTGYLQLDRDSEFKGPLQAAIAFMTYLMLVAVILHRSLERWLLPAMLAVVCFLGLLTLSVGARQTFVLTLIAALACRSFLRRGLPRSSFFLFGLLGAAIFGFIGNWRSASTDSPIYESIVLEPLFTFISLPTLITFTKLPLFSVPYQFLVGFTNIIPSAIWQGKHDFFVSLANDFKFYSPFGAINLGASLLINFGWAGSVLFSCLLGFGSERLHQAAHRRPLFLATYCLLIAVLSFDLWRNPLEIPVVKNIFQAGVLLPLFLVLAKNLLAKRYVSPIDGHGALARV